MKTNRILCIDFGEKYIGLAISDPLGLTAQPLNVLVRKRSKEDLLEIQTFVEQYNVERIVIGLPLNMNGSEGFMVKSMRDFSDDLQKVCSIEIIEFDERLTSYQAEKAFQDSYQRGKRKKKKKKKKIDSISAQIILQTYLNYISN